MSKNVKLTMSRYGTLNDYTYKSVKSAARDARTAVEFNKAMPVRIGVDDTVIWENTGPINGCYNRLYELAKIDQDDI